MGTWRGHLSLYTNISWQWLGTASVHHQWQGKDTHECLNHLPVCVHSLAVNAPNSHNVQQSANIYATCNWQSLGMHVEHEVNKCTCVYRVLHCGISQLPFIERAWSMQLYSRSCGSLAEVWYGPEIKSNIKAGSWCIKQIFWENRRLKIDRKVQVCVCSGHSLNFSRQKTFTYLLTIRLCKRKIFSCHDYASNLTMLSKVYIG